MGAITLSKRWDWSIAHRDGARLLCESVGNNEHHLLVPDELVQKIGSHDQRAGGKNVGPECRRSYPIRATLR